MPEFSVDAIAVLGARIEPDGLPGPATRRRVEQAAEEFERGVAPLVVPTGGRRWHGHLEAVSMRHLLRRLGVPDGAIILEPFALSTSENAFFTTRLARLKSWSRLMVVTCPWHMARAVADFEACGLSVVASPTTVPPASTVLRTYRTSRERVCLCLDSVRLRGRFPW